MAGVMRRPHARYRAALWMAAVLGAASALAAPLEAQARPLRWIDTHVIFEGQATASWRVTLGQDERVPGFQALSGGGQLGLGVELGAGLGLVVVGRGVYGRAAGPVYVEADGQLLLKLQVSQRVNLRTGPLVGRLWLDGGRQGSPYMVGGLLGASVDFVTLGRSALTLTASLDVTRLLAPPRAVPDASLSFVVGVGARY